MIDMPSMWLDFILSRHRHHRHRRHPHHPRRVALFVMGAKVDVLSTNAVILVDSKLVLGILLEPKTEINLMTTVTVGHALACTIVYLDQNGNPMLKTPAADSAPTWSNSNTAAETLKPAPDGLTCEADAIAVGSDVITLSLTSGGATFGANLSVTVEDAPQVLTSVAISATAI